MKKVILLAAVVCMIVIGVFMHHFTANKVNIKTDIDTLLQPYQKVIDKINAESDSDIDLVFPEENKEQIYAAYKDMSISEFEETMREERDTVLREYEKVGAVLYIDATKGSGNEIYYDENHNRIELTAEDPEADKEWDKTDRNRKEN